MPTVTYLSSDDVSELATPQDFIGSVRAGYRERGEGAPAKPRTTLFSNETPGMLTGYLAILPEMGYMGGYSYAAGFEQRDAWFATPLFDAQAGELLAILDGASMNPFKTGAAGAVGVDALARTDAAVLGIIGSGSQARGQLLATEQVRDFEQIYVYSPTKSNRDAFVHDMRDRVSTPITAVDSPESLVPESDVVITATTASDPVFDGSLLEPGTHVTSMGQYNPNKREIDTHTVERSTYVIDLVERANQDAGAFLAARADGAVTDAHIHAELGDIVAGNVPGRTHEDEITVFDSGGTAIETVASAGLLYERAIEAGLGNELSLSSASEAFL